MRLMGLDIGERRIGIAYANFLSGSGIGSAIEVRLSFYGLSTPLIVPGGFLLVQNREESIQDLADIVREEGVSGIVAGVPLRDGNETKQSEKIRAYCEELKAKAGDTPFYYWDESLTSFGASFLLRDAELKHSGQRTKGRVDSVAATLILKSFCEHWQAQKPQ
jgi:putative transcription antitermination factor YqgF